MFAVLSEHFILIGRKFYLAHSVITTTFQPHKIKEWQKVVQVLK